MSANHATTTTSSIATHVTQSLPSFAQAFSTSSLGSISTSSNSLPPIQTRLSLAENHRVNSPTSQPRSRPPSADDSSSHKLAGKKRTRTDAASNSREDEGLSDSDRDSPHPVQIKEEHEHDSIHSASPTPQPSPSFASGSQQQQQQSSTAARHDSDRMPAPDINSGAPPPSSLLPSPAKKRRVTISGAPHPLNTDVRVSVDQTTSTPISPVVMGFTIGRDDPNALEQVRSMIVVKQKQKALIEQRRGSVTGVATPVAGPGNGPSLLSSSIDERSNQPLSALSQSKQTPASTRALRRSPNAGLARRINHIPGQPPPTARPTSPSPINQQSHQVPDQSSSSGPLPPSISFARRRANIIGQGKKKPADILISPRENQTPDQFQPAIQSAPPVPHAGQGLFSSGGRLTVALPRLPSALSSGENVRRVASNVPPTPTRLSMQRTTSTSAITQPISNISGRSPPAASVPISSTLVPPTPSSLHRPGYSEEKSKFLEPFAIFYDALHDSKQLKEYLADQLQRSKALMQSLTQQQEKLNEMIEVMVERKVAGIRSEMRSEIVDLQRRVEELEDALRSATGQRHYDTAKRQTKPMPGSSLKNGIITNVGGLSSVPTESYTFPPVPPAPAGSSRLIAEPLRASSSWDRERESRERERDMHPDSDTGSPSPYDSRRMITSASRLDPPRSQLPPPQGSQSQQSTSETSPGTSSSSQSRGSYTLQSPPLPQRERDGPSTYHPPSATSSHGKGLRNTYAERDRDRPAAHSRQGPPSASSSPSVSQLTRPSSGSADHRGGSPPPPPLSATRRGESRRDAIMGAPDGSREDS